MKSTVSIESFEELRVRKLERARRLDRGDRLAPERRIAFETPDLLLACLTPQRLRLWRTASEEPRSITELAHQLGRDRKSVHRDVQVLKEAGMITLSKRNNPGHGQLQIVETTARSLELRARVEAPQRRLA